VAAEPARHVPELTPSTTGTTRKRAPAHIKRAAARQKAGPVKTKWPAGESARGRSAGSRTRAKT
jgi:hypothetical protein